MQHYNQQRTHHSENLEDSMPDMGSNYADQQELELDKDGKARQFSKSNMNNMKSHQKLYINIDKIEKGHRHHARKISEVSAGLSRANEKAKSNVDLRGKRSGLEKTT